MITTTFLEISDISNLSPAQKGEADIPELYFKKIDCPVVCSSMYSLVGKRQYWEIYRIGWTNRHWQAYLQRSDIEVLFICAKKNLHIGYLELQLHQNSSVEIVNFGLRPEFIGQGIGSHALVLAVKRGFELGSNGVWLHTCSLDHPSALKNYYARGFKFLREEVTNYLPLDAIPEIPNQSIELI